MQLKLLLAISLAAVLTSNSPFGKGTGLALADESASMPSIVDGFTPEQEEALNGIAEKFEFQAEVNRLMDIIINSLYKNKEVFLREVISNASDALDKIRFLALSAADLLKDNKDLDIKISFDEEKKTLTIRDSGIGMSKADLVANLGTVAKSGTTAFAEAMAGGEGDLGMIGQFGVGFYSVYLVADKVRVISKNPEDEQYVWESTADSSFSISKDPRGNTLGRGTEITLFLKEDAMDLLNQDKLEELVRKYSEFITFPISLYKKSEEIVEIEEVEEEDGGETSTDENGVDIEEEGEDEEEDDGPKTEKIVKWDWVRLNNNVALWARDTKDVTEEEYKNFYKAIIASSSSTDGQVAAAQEALNWIHFKAEGEIEFKSILYVPEDAGNLYNEYTDRKAGIRLYVRKVLIQDDFDDLLPRYLNFIKGVVDSDDLPLNVSRETLQQHKMLKVMGKKLVRKVLEMLRKMSTEGADKKEGEEEEDGEEKSVAIDSERYIKFWEQFGKSIKMGVVEDASNRSKLAKLLRFQSSSTQADTEANEGNNKYISLDAYVANMPEWQKEIYYIAGESMDSVKKSPFLASAKAKNVDVLYLTDPIDEYTVQHLADYDGHKLTSLTKEGLKFGDEDEELSKKRTRIYKETFKPLTKYLKETFGNKVSKVSVAQHPLAAPSVIVSSQYGHSANMERIMKAQTFSGGAGMPNMGSQRVLEINPRHPIIVKLNALVEDESNDNKQQIEDLSHLLYETALISSGFAQDDVDTFSSRMYRMLGSELKVSSMDLEEEIVVEADEEDEEEEEEDIPSFGNEF